MKRQDTPIVHHGPGHVGSGMLDPIVPLRVVVEQLTDVLGSLTQCQYTQNPVGSFNSSIGGHVRHCLDHVEALIAGTAGGFIDYDKRQRGTPVETDPQAACHEINRLCQGLEKLQSTPIDREVTVALMLSGDGPSIHWHSTLGRELAFILSHTIHHGAMIAAMVKQLGITVPEEFGVAPSTIAYRKPRA